MNLPGWNDYHLILKSDAFCNLYGWKNQTFFCYKHTVASSSYVLKPFWVTLYQIWLIKNMYISIA